MPNFFDWNNNVELKNFDPVKLQASLMLIPPQVPIQPTVPTLPTVPQVTPPPPDVTKPVVPETTYGMIQVNSTPSGATILLNGKNTGKTTPATLSQIEAGKKATVSFRLEGYEETARTVSVESNKTASVSASLKKKVQVAPVEPTKPVKPVEDPTPSGPASLSISSDPSGAEVYINSESKGTTPLRVSGLTPGNVKVIISKDGYVKYSGSVNVSAGETKSMGTIRLDSIKQSGNPYGELTLVSSPPRASIIFDGEKIGARTPVTIRKVPRDKTHTVRVELDGYQPWSATVNMSDQETKKYDITLDKK